MTVECRASAGEGQLASFLLVRHAMRRLATIAVCLCLAAAARAIAREPGEPIRLQWTEGDVAGQTAIYAPEGTTPIGVVEYRQRLNGNVLDTLRVARFTDGSSDEDRAVAKVGRTLEAIRGRSIIRDTGGTTIVDLTIDVAKGKVTGFYDDGGTRHTVDLTEELPKATYWGPLIFIVAKNFDANVDDDRVRFQTVVPTPKPRILTMELVHVGQRPIRRMGAPLTLERYTLRPTLGWVIDPIVQRLVPSTEFLLDHGAPPSLGRYQGPRNYAGQEIRLE